MAFSIVSSHHIAFSDCLELSMNVDRLWTQTTISFTHIVWIFYFDLSMFICCCSLHLFQFDSFIAKTIAFKFISKMAVASIDFGPGVFSKVDLLHCAAGAQPGFHFLMKSLTFSTEIVDIFRRTTLSYSNNFLQLER